jgi:CHAT domain-containing protein
MSAQAFEELELKILQAAPQRRAAKAVPPPSAEPPPANDERDLVASAAGRTTSSTSYADTYPVEARTSTREASGTFVTPFTTEELDRLLSAGPRLPEDEIEELGARLFEALFAQAVGELFVLTNQDATRANRGLRFRLRVAPHELAAWPWEILRPSGWVFAPALSDRTPLVRHVDLLDERGTVQVSWPMNVLLVAAAPGDQNRLDLEAELARIAGALDSLRREGKVSITVLKHADAEGLLAELRRGRHHVVHFMMHGDFDKERGRGVVVLEDKVGGSRVLDAEALALAFFSNPGSATRLVLFNTCRSADDSASSPGRGVAGSIVRLNMPAVVAMQYPISDPAAIEFSRELYVRLAEGRNIDEAVALARAAIRIALEGRYRNEWITPVLYLRAREGRLFETPGLDHIDHSPDADRARETVRLVGKLSSPRQPAGRVQDLVVSVNRDVLDQGRFKVSLAFGEDATSGPMELPQEWLERLQPADPSGRVECDPRAPAEAELWKRLGEDLFARLFAGDRALFFRQALGKAKGAGLRLRLVSDDEGIDAVPWECLRDPYSHTFLCIKGAPYTFLRQISASDSSSLDAIEGPLRILFIQCNPRDRAPLNLEREWDWLLKGVQDQPPERVKVDRLRDPTRLQVLEALDAGRHHILHFAGYDSLSASGGRVDEGFLLLDEDARTNYLPYDDLGALLGGSSTLRLVVANTCYTASRLAPSLVRTGLPAVIGMRFGIRDDVAAEFCALFYKALFGHDLAVDVAMAEARKVLYHKYEQFPGNWAYPTLVTSEHRSDVFQVSTT